MREVEIQLAREGRQRADVHRGGESRGVRAQTLAKIRGENGKNPARAT